MFTSVPRHRNGCACGNGSTINYAAQPGPIDTDMHPERPSSAPACTTVGRSGHGRPEEMAAMVACLAGPEAAWVTGADLLIDGGFAA